MICTLVELSTSFTTSLYDLPSSSMFNLTNSLQRTSITTDTIKQVLIKYQHLLPVLFRDHQGIQDKY